MVRGVFVGLLYSRETESYCGSLDEVVIEMKMKIKIKMYRYSSSIFLGFSTFVKLDIHGICFSSV